ncbi:hypothetical protein [Paenibacillus etheri]|uniref:hypothetical protein n=1 Tax=Paenibacillus etheri TaxID=1306852 RepID=UPI0012E3FA6C|nr:hypothetical protein [Paenibacillus etheri]
MKASARFTAIVSQLLTDRSNHTNSVQREPLPETVQKSSCSDGAFERHPSKHICL